MTKTSPNKRHRKSKRSAPLDDDRLNDRGEPGATVRRCVATDERLPKDCLIRFVVAPDGALVPDLAERLPGRGLWLTATRQATLTAVRRKAFSRKARVGVVVPPDLDDRLEHALVDRTVEAIGLARRAGRAIAGFAKVEAAIRRQRVSLRLEAVDGAPDGRNRLQRLAPELPVLTGLTAVELARAFARSHVVHVAISGESPADHGLLRRLERDFGRLVGFREQIPGPGLEKPDGQCIECRSKRL